MLHGENDDEEEDDEEVVQDSIVTSWRTSWLSFWVDSMAAAMWLCWSRYRVVVAAVAVVVDIDVAVARDTHQEESRALEPRDARRSRTTARSESSTSPNTHRPSIESSSSSTPLV